ncbi:MAG TPA: 23S rRNA (pseudouridine(1915)-N(3))-methyltransferase RlmH [Anaerolineae bacterium]|nr:23S rRNA (pseudouridine(1915)-N(3))-methyltransferase RlmH [Anaerolineae bacterium]
MRIKVVAIGKIKEDYLKRGIDDYKNRLSKYAKISIVEVAEEDIALRPESEVKGREAQKLKKHIADVQYVIALEREGMELPSIELAQRLESLMIGGKSNIAFMIGGALGLDESLIRSSDFTLSLSKLTFTHQIARFILLEQLYRSFKIIKGEPYHY